MSAVPVDLLYVETGLCCRVVDLADNRGSSKGRRRLLTLLGVMRRTASVHAIPSSRLVLNHIIRQWWPVIEGLIVTGVTGAPLKRLATATKTVKRV